MPKKRTPDPTIPDTCPTCGQRIDKNSAASIEHHANPEKHLPFFGKRKRPGWK